MNSAFFHQIESILHTERIDAYRHDGAAHDLTLSRNAFPYAPAQEQYQAKLDKRWLDVRDLRNRVFHHERILHWRDLDRRHQAVLDMIAWMSPELHDFANALDRFVLIRKDGLIPWIAKLESHWPKT